MAKPRRGGAALPPRIDLLVLGGGRMEREFPSGVGATKRGTYSLHTHQHHRSGYRFVNGRLNN